MNKTAAIRSQARRAALVKHAGVLDRLAAIGARYKGLLAGNSPLMGQYKWGKQYVDALTSGEAGVSPAAEKLRYMWKILTSNSPVGSELRKVYATRAGTGVAGIAGLKALLGGSGEKKAAEAQFTPEEQAFAAGFCKAAEAMGVDPEALYKEALPAWIGRAGQALLGGAKRVGSWIGSHGGNAVAQSRAGQAVAGGARRFGQLLAGGAEPVRGAFRMGRGDLSGMDKLRGWLSTYWQGLRGGMGNDVASELRRSLAARAGTGAAALGGGAMLLGGGGDGGQA